MRIELGNPLLLQLSPSYHMEDKRQRKGVHSVTHSSLLVHASTGMTRPTLIFLTGFRTEFLICALENFTDYRCQ